MEKLLPYIKKITFIVFLITAMQIFSDDLKTKDGKVYYDYKVTRKTTDGWNIFHRDGASFIPLDQLPDVMSTPEYDAIDLQNKLAEKQRRAGMSQDQIMLLDITGFLGFKLGDKLEAPYIYADKSQQIHYAVKYGSLIGDDQIVSKGDKDFFGVSECAISINPNGKIYEILWSGKGGQSYISSVVNYFTAIFGKSNLSYMMSEGNIYPRGTFLYKTQTRQAALSFSIIESEYSIGGFVNLRLMDIELTPTPEEKAAAMEARIAAEQKELDENPIKSKYDEFDKVTWYKTRREIPYETACVFEPYFGVFENGIMSLRLKIEYHGSDWIFFDKVKVLDDKGNEFSIEVPTYEKNNDSGSGSVWEMYDCYFSERAEDLRKIAQSNSISIRFYGKYSSTHQLSNDQIRVIKEVITHYDKMKNKTDDK